MPVRIQDSASLTYRADIDGLRGVSVLLVMLFHARVPGLEWGYLGVDIFFVISGFLITRLLVDELEASGRPALTRFFSRRARRILPALFVMLVLVAPLAFWLLTPGHLIRFGYSAAAAAVFAANIVQATQPLGYFSAVGDGEALVHLWSLGVEEQYYLVFPFLLWALHRLAGRWLWLALTGLAAASLGLRGWLHLTDPQASFYWMPPRMWELLGGAVIATIPPLVQAVVARFAWPLSVLAIALLAVVPIARWAVGPYVIVHPVFSLPVVAAAALILMLPPQATVTAPLLRWRPLVLIGLISFSAYLWHQPLLVLARAATTQPLTLPASIGLLLLVLVLAAGSWRWVEQPFRRAGWSSAIPTLGWAAGGSALLLAVGLGLAALGASRGTPAITQLAALRDTEYARMESCSFSGSSRALRDACRAGARGPVRLAVHGDSHAAALFGGLGPMAQAAGFGAQEYAWPGCPPMLNVPGLPPHLAHCQIFSARFVRHMAERPSITTVVLTARWPYHLEGSTFDNGLPGGQEPADGTLRLDPVAARKGLEALVGSLQRQGKRVVIVYPAPEAGWLVPDRLLKRSQHRWLADVPMTVPLDRIVSRLARSNAMLDGVRAAGPVLRIDPVPLFCDPVRRLCRQHQGETAWFMDDDHLSPAGAARIWKAHRFRFAAALPGKAPVPARDGG